MKEELKASFRESFVQETNADFTEKVLKKIEERERISCRQPERAGLWVYLIVFAIIGLPLALVIGYAISLSLPVQIPDLEVKLISESESRRIGNFFIEIMPYTLFLLVFCFISFWETLRRGRRVKI
ncbi:hypothetical protein GCM10009118_28490 [Wandonia haliotis]|uniref:Uncharacterized protein n=1 Tax=Wandonia haliotis TaxID=574963 RepID=A0ABN1MT04_9FLAO